MENFKNRIVISVSGGNIQHIDAPENSEVIVIDYDTDGEQVPAFVTKGAPDSSGLTIDELTSLNKPEVIEYIKKELEK